MSSGLITGYSTRDVARVLRLSESKVRGWVRDGLVEPERGPRGEYHFTFQHLVLFRTAKALLAAEISPRRVRRILEGLVDQLPGGRSLTAVHISAQGGQVMVRDGSDTWNPESGQRVFDFQVAELAERAAPFASQVAQRAVEQADYMAAEDWFDLGYELETTSIDESIRAYQKALALREEFPDAHLNIGRMLHEKGELEAAEDHYRHALASRPEDLTAAFNLGVVLQDQEEWLDALEAYQAVLRVDPDYADAHYNLSVVHEAIGDRAAAIQDLKSYKALTGESAR